MITPSPARRRIETGWLEAHTHRYQGGDRDSTPGCYHPDSIPQSIKQHRIARRHKLAIISAVERNNDVEASWLAMELILSRTAFIDRGVTVSTHPGCDRSHVADEAILRLPIDRHLKQTGLHVFQGPKVYRLRYPV